MALVVCCGRTARGCTGNRRLLFSYGRAWRSAVAKSGTTRLDCSDARKAEATGQRLGHRLGCFPFGSSAASRRNCVSELQRFLHFYFLAADHVAAAVWPRRLEDRLARLD